MIHGFTMHTLSTGLLVVKGIVNGQVALALGRQLGAVLQPATTFDVAHGICKQNKKKKERKKKKKRERERERQREGTR